MRNVSVTAYLVGCWVGCWVDSWKKGETVMLNIYLNEEAVPDGVDIDYYSEYVFRNRGPIKFDKKMCDIVYKIDGAKFIDGNVFKDKFGNTISANDLSTGCKTALNVYMDPDRVHCCWECGRNALREICLLDRGNILSLYAPPYLDIDTSANIMLHKNKKQRLVHSYNEAIDNWMNP